jgi:hypothetical protein
MTNQTDTIITLRVPESAWRLLEETLTVDSQSGAFDPSLRKEIRAALDKVEELETSPRLAYPCAICTDQFWTADALRKHTHLFHNSEEG